MQNVSEGPTPVKSKVSDNIRSLDLIFMNKKEEIDYIFESIKNFNKNNYDNIKKHVLFNLNIKTEEDLIMEEQEEDKEMINNNNLKDLYESVLSYENLDKYIIDFQ